jgi:hypothetical protein
MMHGLTKFFIYQLMHKSFALKEILNLHRKYSYMFRFNHRHQGTCYLRFAKVIAAKTIRIISLKYIVVVSSVVWPHILSDPGWCKSVTLSGISLIPNSNFNKAQIARSLMKVIKPKHVEPFLRWWSENFSASTIDGNNIGKIFSPKLVHLS